MSSSYEFNIYYNFIYNALLGQTQESDFLYKEYKESINIIASKLMVKFPVEETTLYRGILLEPKHVSEYRGSYALMPMSHIRTLSFSESRECAHIFADVHSDMSKEVMKARPKSEGYIFTYIPDKCDILYHHSWGKELQINKLFSRLDTELLSSQKEVIVKQRGKIFSNLEKVTPWITKH